MTRAVILVERGFQDEEFVYPYYRMLEDGWDVDVASPDGNAVHGKYGVPARPNANLDMICGRLYDALIIPGGFESPDRLRMHPTVRMIVRWHVEEKRVVGAICHGPWVLVSAGVVRGRNLTGYRSIWPDLENAGAKVDTDARVVVDGKLVTAQHYRDNGAFMREMVKAVNEKDGAWLERHTSTF